MTGLSVTICKVSWSNEALQNKPAADLLFLIGPDALLLRMAALPADGSRSLQQVGLANLQQASLRLLLYQQWLKQQDIGRRCDVNIPIVSLIDNKQA